MKFTWEESMRLNVPEMDNEHMKLIEQANKLFDSLMAHNGSDAAIETLNFLANYAIDHFDSEEKLQKTYNYPHYEEHHQIHEDFKETVGNIISEVETKGISARKKLEINKLTVKWITGHIGREDRKLAQFILKARQDQQKG
jgi:hemerythrin